MSKNVGTALTLLHLLLEWPHRRCLILTVDAPPLVVKVEPDVLTESF